MGGIVRKSKAFDALTDKEKVFLTEWTIDLNATRAAKEAGYKSPNVQGPKMLSKPKIKAAIKEIMEPVLKKAEITREGVLEQLFNFLYRDSAEYTNEDGSLCVHPRELPPTLRQCIESWNYREQYDNEGNLVGKSYHVKWVDKKAALDLAMKYLRLIGPEVAIQNNNVIDVEGWWNKFFDRAKQPVNEPIDAEIKRLISEGVDSGDQGQIESGAEQENGHHKSNGKAG